MRAKEFIIEAAWDGMIDRMMRQYPDKVEAIKSYTTWAKQALKKQDRIVWFLKQFESDTLRRGESLNTLVNRLQHFMGIEYQPIQNLQWRGQTPQILLAQLAGLEAEYKQKQTVAQPVAMQEGDRVIKDWGNGMQWIFTNRAYCPDEGRSGKHCGNVVGRRQTDQRILSLRNRGHVELTFILHPDGSLGEMKARGNTKPKPNLHPYILWLLEQPFIKDIHGGGYAPGRNFHLKDFGPEFIDRLQAARPDFADWDDVAQARAKQQALGAGSFDDASDATVDAIINAIMSMVTPDLEKLVSDTDPDRLDDLEEGIDYRANAESLRLEWADGGVDAGYYEEGSLTLGDIPRGLAYVIGLWNDLTGVVFLEEVLDLVKVTYDQNTWRVTYKGQSATGAIT